MTGTHTRPADDGGGGNWEPISLPPDLPMPMDDGKADHLIGIRCPGIVLRSTNGRLVRFAESAAPRTVVYCYPRTGRPGVAPLSEDWDQIPGARGCTPEACSFRDHHEELLSLGAEVYGMSTQDTGYQREAVERLHLPFPLLSDANLELSRALRLPTFEVAGATLLKRLTFAIRGGRLEHVWYPVFPPDRHADEIVSWLKTHQVH